MIKDGALEIGQTFYGSFSGYHDYRILAASPASDSGFRREDREIISLRSNLGGSAQTANFVPIFSFYEVDRQRRLWAFSRTVLLGRGPRGNDYLAHVLALDAEVMEILRGDPFLLERLFEEKKTQSEASLEALTVPLSEVENLALRPCGAALDRRLDSTIASGFLLAIARGSLAVPLDDGEAAVSLCRSMVSLLPPEDREILSFCSRFSLPRRTSFRLAVYASDDASLAERYLTGFNPAAASGAGDAFLEWVEACQRLEIEPFYSLPLFTEGAEGAIRIVQAISGEGSVTGDKGGRRLRKIIFDPRNHRLESAQRLLRHVAWEEVQERAEEVLSSPGTSLVLLEEACRRVWSFDPSGSFLSSSINATARLHGGRGFEMEGTTAILALAVLVPGQQRPDLVLASKEGPALFQKGQAAKWALEMDGRNRGVYRGLLKAWFTAWRHSNGLTAMHRVLEELKSLPQGESRARSAAATAFTALLESSPEGGAERTAWLIELVREGSRSLGYLLAASDVARLALQESLLEDLPENDAAQLIQVLCSELPPETAAWLEHDNPSTKLLVLVALACGDGLTGCLVGAAGWPDLEARRWTLVARIADALVKRARIEPSQRTDLGLALAGLLYPAAMLAPDAAVSRIAIMVKATLEAQLPGGIDLLIRAAAALAARGEKTSAYTAVAAAPVLRTQSEKDFWLSGRPGGTFGACLLDAAWAKVMAC